MQHPVATILVIYLGLGAIFVFFDMRLVKRLIEDAQEEPYPFWIYSTILSIALTFIICTWPIWAVVEVYDRVFKRK